MAPRAVLLGLAAAGAAALRTRNTTTTGQRDLALVDVPFNFGITISKVAGLGSGKDWAQQTEAYFKLVHMPADPREASWAAVHEQATSGAAIWGGLNPDLRAKSAVTGCPLHNTPQKWWPRPLAEKYFGNKTMFGILRDPYERLVSFHRDPDFYPGCDVNKAVKNTLKRFARGDVFAESCRFLPQAAFFDGPFGITVPLDIRKFPQSANELLEKHGYDNVHIKMDDVLRAGGCQDVWAGDLDNETRALARQIYKRDFELLCKHFGYCNPEETTCLAHIPGMCPDAHSQGI